MNQTDNLDNLIKKEFDELHFEFDEGKRKFINPKSVSNIVFYLIDNPQLNPRRNQKLQELGEIRMKKKLLEYLKEIRNTDLDLESATDLYDRYFMEIGEFMTEYYGFSGHGGNNFLIPIVLLLSLGIIADTIIYLIDWIAYPIFSLLFLTLFLVRRVIKSSRKKHYGFLY